MGTHQPILDSNAQATVTDKKLETSGTKAHVSFLLDPMLEPVEYPPPPFDDALSHKLSIASVQNLTKHQSKKQVVVCAVS